MTAIIFDFDGTIADSFDYVAGFLAGEAGHGPLSNSKKQELRSMSMAAMARHLGYHWWQMPGLLFRARRRMAKVMKRLQPFDSMPGVIEKLHAEGHELFIVSSNSVHNIRLFLRHHELQTYFLEIYGGIGLFGKAPALRRLLRAQNIDKNNALYIGDELRDVQAAQSIELRVIAVTWGFARVADLESLKPTGLAHVPAELTALISDL